MKLSINLSKGLLSLSFLFLQTFSFAQQNLTPQCGFDQIQRKLKAEDKLYEQAIQRYKQEILPQLSQLQFSRSGTINVPVVVHIIHSGEAIGNGSNLSAERIQAQIDILNEDFSATNPNYSSTPARWAGAIGNPDIQFCLASVDPSGNPTTGIARHQLTVTGSSSSNNNIESEIKPAVNWNPALYYNIYVLPIPGTTAGGGVTGYAYLPYPGSVGNPNIDGSVVDYRWFGGPGYGQSGYKTLTHETGHYLGLFHTFDGESCSDDDGISDTPNISAATSDMGWFSCTGGFPAGPMSCGNEHMYINYMDYASGSCYTSFTQGQNNVMRAVLEGTAGIYGWASRANLANNAQAVCALNQHDAGVTAILSPAANECGTNEIVAEVRITNFGVQTLNNVKIRYQLDNGSIQESYVQPNLISGASANFILTTINPATSPFLFTAYTAEPNGQPDEQHTNDTMSVSSIFILPQQPNLEEGFEEGPFNPTTDGIIAFNVSNDVYEWDRTTAVSAYGIGNAAVMMDNYNAGQEIYGTLDALLTPVYNFSSTVNASLAFDIAYARYTDPGTTLGDSLLILVSTDCGGTYDQVVFRDGDASMETASATGAPFTPAVNEWRSESIDLSTYNNIDNISFAFVNKSGWGNRLFLDNIQIESACAITGTTSTTDILCHNDCNGSAAIVPAGGNGSYSYQWDTNAGSQQTQTATQLCAGTYQVTVTDNNGCALSSAMTIHQPDLLELQLSATNESGANAMDGVANATPSGGTSPFSFMWNTGAVTAQITGLSAGYYSVTVTDANSCTRTSGIEVEQSIDCSNLTATFNAGQVSCAAGNDGHASAMPAGGSGSYTYLWNTGQQSQSIQNLVAGIYTITISASNGCTLVEQLQITEPAALEIQVNTIHESVEGANDGIATANVSGGSAGYSYLWNTGANTSQISDLAPDIYSITVTDNHSCTQTATVTIQPGVPDCSGFALEMEKENVSCAEGSDGMARVHMENGSGAYCYNWNNGANTQTIQNITEGMYAVTVTASNGCVASSQVEIEAPPALQLNVNVSHETYLGEHDGSATAQASGGTAPYVFQWSNGAMTAHISGLSPGNYSVTITDAHGCTDTQAATIEEGIDLCAGFAISQIELQHLSCFGDNNGSIVIHMEGGESPFVFKWDHGPTNSSVQGLVAGTYSVTISDDNQCTVTSAILIDEPSELQISQAVTHNVCGNLGSISASASGGTSPYQYAWDSGQTDQHIAALEPGFYTLTVTDDNACVKIKEIEIREDSKALEVESQVSPISCFGDADGNIDLTIVSGNAPYDYNWSNGASSEDLLNIGSGMYNIQLTDHKGCTYISSFQMNAPGELTVEISGSNPSGPNQNDGQAVSNTAGGTPPYSYQWSNGSTSVVVNNLTPGVYQLTVTDAHQCTSSATIALEIGTAANDLESLNLLKVFPNPASDLVQVQAYFNTTEKATIEIFDLIGHQIYQQTTESKAINWMVDLSNHAAGVYWIRISTHQGSVSSKLTLNR